MARLLRLRSVEVPPCITGPASESGSYVCFFDRGSRGNLGPGGAGSVIVKVDGATRAAHIIWFAATAYGRRDTTNNAADYWGLVHGLRQAVSHSWTPLHIVGDNTFILSQVRSRKKPKAYHLVKLHQQATRLAAEACVVSWKHHLRAYNKMADAAANLAMDDAASTHSMAADGRAELSLLVPYLESDIGHSFSRLDGG